MLTLLEPSGIDVVSLAEVKAHLRLDQPYEDDYLQTLIQSATEHVEQYLGRSLIAKTWHFVWKNNLSQENDLVSIPLPCPPLLEILSIEKVVRHNRKSPIKRYLLEYQGPQPKITFGTCAENIEITYKAGYGQYPKHVPSSIRQAILLKIADFYENRVSTALDSDEKSISLFKKILSPYRMMSLL